MIFPVDAIQLNFTTPANSGVVLLNATSGVRTILNVLDTNYGTAGDMYITDDSNGSLLVDATPVLRQDNRFTIYKTSGQITSHNSAPSGNSTGQIVYVNYDLATTSSSLVISPTSFSGGEVVNSVLLLFILTGLALGFIVARFFGFAIKKKF